jgi:hypothetical protein
VAVVSVSITGCVEPGSGVFEKAEQADITNMKTMPVMGKIILKVMRVTM